MSLPLRGEEPFRMENFVARQPIFDTKLDVFAYELLFRAGIENAFPNTDGDEASSSVLADSFINIGISSMTGGKKAFINFTENLLLQEMASLFPPENTVVEILETIEPTAEIVAVCREMKKQGYTLALDDFEYHPKWDPMIEIADIIKVDFLHADAAERKAIASRYRPHGITMLAEKVETWEDFQQAVLTGYELFQGYFFSKPQIVKQKKLSENKISRLLLLKAVHQKEYNVEEVEEIMKQDMALSYKLLKYINSSFFGLRHKVYSIRQALLLLGTKNVRKWVDLLALASAAEDKPSELILNGMVRAKFCESFASLLQMESRADDLFLMGLFSLIDAVMDRPMKEILDEIALQEDVRAALLNEPNELRCILDAVIAYDTGDWDLFTSAQEALGVDPKQIPPLYLDAVTWARNSFQAQQGD